MKVVEILVPETKDFKKFDRTPMGTEFHKIEYEELAAWIVNKLIDENLPIDSPLQLRYDHYGMVSRGFLKDHGNRNYSLTQESINILFNYQNKKQ